LRKVQSKILGFYSGAFEDSDTLGSYDISSGKWLPKFDGPEVKEIPGLTLEMNEI
jgi:hypothetical protein